MLLFHIFLIIPIVFANFQYEEEPHFHQELFGTGDFQAKDKKEGSTKKHLSSSTEDLIILFEAEKELIRALKTGNFSSLNHESKTAYLKAVDFE